MSAGLIDVCLVGQGLLSAYGAGVEACADGLLEGRRALTPAGGAFAAPLAAFPVAAVSSDIPAAPSDSRFLALLKTLLAGLSVPSDTSVYVATTVGEITLLENAVASGEDAAGAAITRLPRKIAEGLGLEPQAARVVSSACASSTAALALAASAIRSGERTSALVIGCDCLSEFVLSGFAALMALDAEGARPFDAARKGVTLGEAAVFAFLMSGERARRDGYPCLGHVKGWSLTCDANHLTGPSRDGAPLADAVRGALRMAGCPAAKVQAICAHGTGTPYNDQMEMLAFKRVFGERPIPTFSVKGGMGHTLGAAGLAEALLSLEFLRRGVVPPTVGLHQVSEDAQGWASARPQPLASEGVVVSTNSGFGGTNAAVVLALEHDPTDEGSGACGGRICITGRGAAGAEEVPPDIAPFVMPRNFGRFSAETRMAFYAVAKALREAKRFPGERPLRVGVVAFDKEGSLSANAAYYADYVQSGRVLGRGQLFVYTLPTSVAAECAIACRLAGPLLYVAASDGGAEEALASARRVLADGMADAMVLMSAGVRAASALVVSLSESASEADVCDVSGFFSMTR